MPFPTFTPQALGKLQHRVLMLSVLGCALILYSPAQALYKIVEPDGTITYTDQPPPPQKAGQVTPIGPTSKALTSPSITHLPFELKQVVAEFPVTIYTLKSDCPACDQGRALLKQRGVPFSERHIISKADLESLKALTGAPDTPVMVVGKQVNRGFSAEVWNQYLDFAGYPKTSRLPATYRFEAPEPLTKQQSAETIEETNTPPANRPAPVPQPGTRASRLAEKNSANRTPSPPPRDPNAIQF
ncbi:MAG: glutaredoxin domain-containing protein [Burkholderiales bacterium]